MAIRDDLKVQLDAVDKEGDEYVVAVGELNEAKTARDDAKTTYDTAQTAVDGKQAQVGAEKSENIVALQALLAAIQERIEALSA